MIKKTIKKKSVSQKWIKLTATLNKTLTIVKHWDEKKSLCDIATDETGMQYTTMRGLWCCDDPLGGKVIIISNNLRCPKVVTVEFRFISCRMGAHHGRVWVGGGVGTREEGERRRVAEGSGIGRLKLRPCIVESNQWWIEGGPSMWAA